MLYISYYIILLSFMYLVTRTHSYMMDTLCALTIVFPSVLCVCSFCMYHIPETPWSTWIATCPQLRPTTSPFTTTVIRCILWTSPCQESAWQVTRATSISHTKR